jgi:hypothetical protein
MVGCVTPAVAAADPDDVPHCCVAPQYWIINCRVRSVLLQSYFPRNAAGLLAQEVEGEEAAMIALDALPYIDGEVHCG